MGTADFSAVVEGFDQVADSLVIDTTELGADRGQLLCSWYSLPASPSPTSSRNSAGRCAPSLPRHVPDRFIVIGEVPRTLSGKKLEVPVKRLIQGHPLDAGRRPRRRRRLRRARPVHRLRGAPARRIPHRPADPRAESDSSNHDETLPVNLNGSPVTPQAPGPSTAPGGVPEPRTNLPQCHWTRIRHGQAKRPRGRQQRSRTLVAHASVARARSCCPTPRCGCRSKGGDAREHAEPPGPAHRRARALRDRWLRGGRERGRAPPSGRHAGLAVLGRRADPAADGLRAVGTAVLSVSSPGAHFGHDAAARALARQVNEFGAGVARKYPDRFGHFASLPLPDVDGSLASCARARRAWQRRRHRRVQRPRDLPRRPVVRAGLGRLQPTARGRLRPPDLARLRRGDLPGPPRR